jgi:hypothetical protein
MEKNMVKPKIDWNAGQWLFVVYGLDALMERYMPLPEPMRSRELAPIAQMREQVVAMLNEGGKK